jgi:hypothetical protein
MGSAETGEALQSLAPPRLLFRTSLRRFAAFAIVQRRPPEQSFSRRVIESILLFASLLTVPLARQGCLDAALLAGLQVVGVTLYFLDDVLLLYLPLEPAQSVFQRFAFLNANLRQRSPPPNLPVRLLSIIPEF